MSHIAREQSARSEPEVAPEAWIYRLLEAVESLPPIAPFGESDPGATAIVFCSAERIQRERELAAARLAEWTV